MLAGSAFPRDSVLTAGKLRQASCPGHPHPQHAGVEQSPAWVLLGAAALCVPQFPRQVAGSALLGLCLDAPGKFQGKHLAGS